MTLDCEDDFIIDLTEIKHRPMHKGSCAVCGNPVVNPRHWRGDDPVHVECLSKLRVDTYRNEV